jgi:hypothetical protein
MKFIKTFEEMVYEKNISDMDQILDKISIDGIDSLTADEKEFLETG